MMRGSAAGAAFPSRAEWRSEWIDRGMNRLCQPQKRPPLEGAAGAGGGGGDDEARQDATIVTPSSTIATQEDRIAPRRDTASFRAKQLPSSISFEKAKILKVLRTFEARN